MLNSLRSNKRINRKNIKKLHIDTLIREKRSRRNMMALSKKISNSNRHLSNLKPESQRK